jgi:hypothetical protein
MESAHTEKITRPLGAAFRSNTLKKLDGRTKTARRLREIISELTEHCGGVERVSAAQRYLIERTAIDILRLEALDVEMAAGTVSAHDARISHALRGSVRLALRDLHTHGMKAAAPQQPSLAEHLAALAAARRDDEGEVAA